MRLSTLRKFGAALALTAFSVTSFAQSSGFDTSRMDISEQACTDFFQYANGTWIKNTEIPADRSRYGSFDILYEGNQNSLHSILEAAAKNTKVAKGSNEELFADYYASCMDEAAIEKADTQPLKQYFALIDNTKDAKGLINTIAVLHSSGFPGLFGFGVSPDIKNSTMNLVSIRQGGLTLPNRDYYVKDEAKFKETREKFVEYMTNMFVLTGADAAKAKSDAETVLAIQTRLAQASKSPIELRDPATSYHKMQMTEAAALAPNFNLASYAKERGASSVMEINVAHPDFFKEANAMLTGVPLDQWKTYLRWMVLNSSANRLSKRFVDESFNFNGKYLNGAKEQQPRWKRCVGATDGAVGEALGAEYVKKSFTPAAAKRVSELIDNLFAAYRERLGQLDWMSPATREKALAKLSTYQRKIGFNQNPRGFAGLKLSRKSYFDNGRSVAQFEINRSLKDIGQKVDKTRWGMTPPTVNAYYNSSFNEIVFPAGILQPPFFNDKADDAINYGAIGAVIGHEITHGFDDQGSKFDAVGNNVSWWTPEDRTKFEERASCVADQFTDYEVAPGLHMQGRLTLGENIADLGGLTMAYKAYQKSLEGKPRPANVDGFTPEQRFFLGYAQVWAAKARAEAERQQVQTDPHALPHWRVNGPLSNLAMFAEAFSCKTGDAMVRETQCRIW